MQHLSKAQVWDHAITRTHLLRCKWQKVFQAFLCPTSGSAAPEWWDRKSWPPPFSHLSPCLSLGLALSPVHRSVAAGAELQAGELSQSQQQPNNGEKRGKKRKNQTTAEKNKTPYLSEDLSHYPNDAHL